MQQRNIAQAQALKPTTTRITGRYRLEQQQRKNKNKEEDEEGG
jgi:hypothetical protein